MKKVRFGFAFKMAVLVSLITFVVILVVNYLVLDYFYGLVRNYTENMLKVMNKGLKDDFFLWSVEEIKNYGDEIVENNYDEYEFYNDTVKGNIVALTRSYDVISGVKTGYLSEYEDLAKGEKLKDLFTSTFYWDGSRIYSLDYKYDDEEFIEYLKNSKFETGQTNFFLSKDQSKLIFIYKLKKGILGGSVSPEKYNEVWIRNVFRGVKLNFYVNYEQKSDNRMSHQKFSKIISDVSTTRDIESVYVSLSKKMKKQDLEVVGDILFDTIFFLVYQNYEAVTFKGILEIPIKSVFPFSALEMSVISSGPILILVLIIMFIVNNRIFVRIRNLSERISELGRSGGDLSYRVEAKTNISEVREVAENINNFLDAVEEIVKKSKNTFRDVEQNIQVLSELGEEVVRVS
ncbi:MAG: HAMP domain-containing protein, partial [Spirochaetia bacterium]|nr:HAMP domain-containing protein [Spirochaetota bacterium]MDW8112479.1 HAMP domain-containing protein [Spirochaetia bacterium]